MSQTRSVITGLGHYLPAKVLTNDELAQRVETSDEWIRERTGIEQRHIAADGEVTSDLAAAAAKEALANAGLKADDIDLVLVATGTPDDTMPATAVHTQHKLGMTRGAGFDLQAACSGFVYGLHTADAFLRAGSAKRVLVIGAETFSRVVDWNDRGTCILFGDGAGAVVVEASTDEKTRGILHSEICSDGQYAPLLCTTGGVSRTQTTGVLTMQGREVFRHAVAKMSEAVERSLVATGLAKSDIDYVVAHQANARILSSVADKLGVPHEKALMSVDKHGNTSAASIPLALAVAQQKGQLEKGQLLALPALGAGLTWGNCLLRW